MSPRIYIAGPISGRPVDVYTKAFREAQAALEAKGWEVVCPLDIPPHEHEGPCPESWGGGEVEPGVEAPHRAACYMRTGIAALMTCDAIYALWGYQFSRGARIELGVAKGLGLSDYREGPFEANEYPEVPS